MLWSANRTRCIPGLQGRVQAYGQERLDALLVSEDDFHWLPRFLRQIPVQNGLCLGCETRMVLRSQDGQG